MTEAEYRQQQREREDKRIDLCARAFAIFTDARQDNDYTRNQWIKDYREFYHGPDDRATKQAGE